MSNTSQNLHKFQKQTISGGGSLRWWRRCGARAAVLPHSAHPCHRVLACMLACCWAAWAAGRSDSGDWGGDNTEQMELRAGELGLSPRSNVYHYSGFPHPSHIPIRLHFFFFFSLWIMEHCISALLKRYTALYSYNT